MCCPRKLTVPCVETSHDPRVCIFRNPAPHLAPTAVGVPLVVVVVVHVVHLEVGDQRNPRRRRVVVDHVGCLVGNVGQVWSLTHYAGKP